MLPGWQGIALAAAMMGQWPSPRLLVLFLVGAALMRTAGCAYNDIVDRDIDAKVARTAGRPVASGRISPRAAWIFVIACALVSLAILLSFNLLTVLLGVASLGLVAAYPFMKRITWWPQLWLGLTFNWGVLMGFAAAQGGRPAALSFAFLAGAWSQGVDLALMPEHWIALPALLLYAALVLWTLGYDTIYAVQDLEDDALAGVKSSARRLGAAAPRAVLVFYMASFALTLAAWWSASLGPLFLPVAALYGAHLARQPTRLRLNDPAGALAIFQSNTLAGLLLVFALVLGRYQIGLLPPH